MASKIEYALYGEWADRVSPEGEVGCHSVVEFSVFRDFTSNSDVVRIAVARDEYEHLERVVATFPDATLGRILQPDYDPEFTSLPWGIIGFHCTGWGREQWSFQLNCHQCRVQWDSKWPSIERMG